MNKWLVRIVVSIVIFVLFIRYIDVFGSLSYLTAIQFDMLILALLFVFSGNVLRALRLQYLCSGQVGLKRNLLVHNFVPLISLATPFKLGEGYKIFLLGKSKKELGFVYILEKAGDMIILFLFALTGIFLFSNFIEVYALSAFFIILGIVFLLNIERVLNFVLRKKTFEKGWFLKNLKEVGKRKFIIFLIFSVIVFFNGVLIFYFFSLSVGAMIPFLTAISFIGIITFVSIVSSLPGGFGAREFTTSFLFINFLGTTSALAGAVSLIVLIGNNLMLLFLFLISYPLYRKYYGS